MTAAARVEVETRPQAVADAFLFSEIVTARVEEGEFVGGEAWNWRPGARPARPHSRIHL